MAANLCLPSGGCSHACQQGRDCEGARQATLRILPRFIARMCEGGESVSNGKAATACSYCTNGICRGMEACEHRPA